MTTDFAMSADKTVRQNFQVKDNYLKPTLDALVEYGAIRDDRYIYRLVATKHQVEEKEREKIEISIKKYDIKIWRY